ncbi:putative C6 transcription factor [Hypomontagnella submonticulosa]|nr:putative C6 transcription factor [Hypomontagnella submonticulosa]
MAESERRRRRPPVSCTLCRRRKIRCNRESPCSNCVRSKSGNCFYENYISPPPPSQRPIALGQGPRRDEPHFSPPTNSISSAITATTAPTHTSNPSPRAPSSTTASTRASQQSSQDVESLKVRIRQLEDRLSRTYQASSRSPAPSSNSNIEVISTGISGTFYVHHDDQLVGPSQSIHRSVSHKSRVFGQSHWITGFAAARSILNLIEPYVREETSRIFILMTKAKSLARAIKARRNPLWPSPPVSPLPPKDVADELVDRYFQTTECVYRILHIPTFRRDYEAYWVSNTPPNAAFLIQLKLVLAIGATTYDERFSLRASAMQWVYEAQTWVSEPGFKHRLNIQYIQTNILVLLAREFVDVGPDLVWISAGSLFRIAVYMGLHRDPSRLPKTTTYVAEMRRRLWNTILEVSLQLSLNSGGPPFISLDMFDTGPPGNFDDEQLNAEDPVPKPENQFTQTSVALALRQTFPVRLAITKFLNDHGAHGTYGETLRLDADLRASYKPVLQNLQTFKSGKGPRPSEFELDVVGIITNRYILSLHIPFFGLAIEEAVYAFSRKVIIETSLKIWHAVYSPTTTTLPQIHHDTAPIGRHALARLVTCASGFFRIVAVQAHVLIATELTAQLREEETLGPGLVRQDLIPIIDEAKVWSLQCIEAGETSIKGYFLVCLLASQIEGLRQGLGKEELGRFMVKAAEESEERCLPMIEEMAAQWQAEGAPEGLDQTAPASASATPSRFFDDWDFAMEDAMFDLDNTAPMNWSFNEASQGPSMF